MLPVKVLIPAFILLFFNLCGDETDDCLEYALPESFTAGVYFPWSYCDDIDSYDGTENDFPGFMESLQNRIIVITFYKEHCGGQLSSPMQYRYKITENAIVKEGIGVWSININNSQENLIADIQFEGSAVADSYKINLAHYANKRINVALITYINVKDGRMAIRDDTKVCP
jgi:hypothetical protein